MTLQQLIYFYEVANTLHFTKSANNLYIAQSALSYSISSLEQELAVPLFVRESNKNITLTTFGSALVPLAKAAIDSFANIENTIRKMRNPLSGVVTIAYSYINGHRFIPQMFAELSSLPQFSETNFSFNINHHKIHFEPEVAIGGVDIAFSCRKSTEGVESVEFAKQRLYVMCSTRHPFASRSSVTLAEVADELIIGYDKGRNLDEWLHMMMKSHNLRLNVDLYANDWVEQLTLIAVGRHVAILPLLPFDQDLIRAVPLDDDMAVRPIYMMWAQNRKLSPIVQYVRDCCLNYFDTPPIV